MNCCPWHLTGGPAFTTCGETDYVDPLAFIHDLINPTNFEDSDKDQTSKN